MQGYFSSFKFRRYLATTHILNIILESFNTTLSNMAEFLGHLQSFNPGFSSEVNSNIELQANCMEAYENNVNSAAGHGLMRFSNDIFPDHQHSTPFHVTSMDHNSQNLGISYPNDVTSTLPFVQPPETLFGPITTGKEVITDNSATPSAPHVFGLVSTGGNDKSLGGRKRKRNIDKEMEKPKEVVHVRAKRGQATDSHSLAERVRREKINERLRCLQDLVPGCYKTMGMAVMLDVVINYVQSLQNQIEFLSMKLSAASMFYDFNLTDLDAVEAMQARNAYGAQ